MEERIYQGYVYRRSGPGQSWEMVGPAQAPASTQRGRVIADPYRASDEARKDQNQALDEERLKISQRAEGRQAATLPYDVRRAAAEATTAEAKATAAVKEQAVAPNPEMDRVRNALKTDSVLEAIGTARRQIQDGWATGNFAGTATFQGIPWAGQNSANLHSTLSGLQGSIINDTLAALKAASANGASGYGSLTESEAQRLAAAVGALQQTQDSASLEGNLARVERHYRNALALLNNEDPRLPEIAAKYGIGDSAKPPHQGVDRSSTLVMGPGSADQAKLDIPTGATRTTKNPALAGVNARVNEMMRARKPDAEITGYLQSVGVNPAETSIGQALQWRRDHPEYGGAYTVNLDDQIVPMSEAQQALNRLGSGPLGAATIGAADAITMGTLDNMTSNPEVTRAIMAGVSEQNPLASFAGQIGGSLIPGLGIENALGRVGMGALGRARGGDLLYGAAYGAGGADDAGDSRITSALLGGGAGMLGGAGGRQLSRTVGRGMSGINDAATVALDRAGVGMTPGQIFGGVAKRTEDRLAGLPLVGDAIVNARRQGFDDFNRAAFDEALAPIQATTGGRVAEAGAEAAHDATSQAYRTALDGVEVTADNIFEDDLLNAVNALRQVPRVGEEVADSVGEIVNPTYFGVGDSLSGAHMQPMVRELRALRNGYATDPLGQRVGQGVGRIEDAVTGMFERQAPEVMPAYRAADQAYRNTSVIDDALLAAMNGNSGVFTPAQLGNAAKANAKKFGGRRAAAEGIRPFYELQRAGQEVLPSQIPDSGTAGRIALPLILGGAAGGGSYAAQEGEGAERAGTALGIGGVAAALAATPYSRPARQTLQRALLAERPEMVRRIGDTIYDYNRLTGWVARPAAITGASQ